MSSYSDAANTIAQLYLQKGAAQAEGSRNIGQLLGGAVANIGQTIQNYPAQQAQMREAQQRAEMGDIQIRQARQQERATQIFDEAYKQGINPDGSINYPKISGALAQGGLGHLVPDVQAKMSAAEKANADLAETYQKLGKGEREQMAAFANAADAVPDPTDKAAIWTSLVTHAAKSGALNPEHARDSIANMLGQDGNPDPQKVVAQINSAKRLAGEAEKPVAVGAGSTLVNPQTGTPIFTAPSRPVEVARGGTLVNPDTGATVATGQPIEPAAKGLQAKDVLIDGRPSVASFNPADGSWEVNGQKVDAGRVKPIPPASVQAAQATSQTTQIKPGSSEYKVAQDLASGKLSFSQFRTLTAYGRDVGKKMAIYQTAAELNPEFNPSQFELGFKMASNPAFRNRLVAINALGPVIDQIDTLAQQVGNGDVPAINKLLQGAKFQMGNRTVTNFRQLQVLLGDEVGNALGVGTGSDLKTRLGLDLVNPNLGPKQFADTMQQLRAVLDARKAEILRQMGMYAPPEPAAAPPPSGNAKDPLGLGIK